ncbi:MAG: hypothetical protein LV480_10675 [Methylacidiphilales bacterium]|nr:hypothetical protein [Candidatus Methylacidiphilales bacterium]
MPGKPTTPKLFLVTFLLTLAAIIPTFAQSSGQSSGPIPCPTPTASAPIWGKLVLSGNTVTCYYAAGVDTPTTWTQIGSPQTIGLINNPILVGIYLSSHNASALGTGTIDNLSISPTPTYRLADGDIGAPELMGSANQTNGVWSLAGSGTDVWGSSDQFNFQPWLVWGDCTIVCRVTSLSVGNPWQKIGIMIRDGYNSGSDYALFCATYASGIDFQYRQAFNNNPDKTLLVAPSAPGSGSGVAIGYSLTGSTAYVVRP